MPDRTLEEYYAAQKRHEKDLQARGITEGLEVEGTMDEMGLGGDPRFIAAGARELGTQALGGVRDAIEEFGEALNWLASEFDLSGVEDAFSIAEDSVYRKGEMNLADIGVPEIEHSDSTVANLTRGISQFITGFLLMSLITGPVGETVGAGKGFLRLASKYPQAFKTLSVLAEGAAAGALTDFFFFDPDDPRMAQLLEQLDPRLSNPITDYLKADLDDPEALKRFKAATEGAVLGTFFNALVPILKGSRNVVAAKLGTRPPGTTFRRVTPEEFIAARNQAKRQAFLTGTSVEDLANHELYLNEFDNVGHAISPDKDMQNLFNASGTPGLGQYAIEDGLARGGQTLDAFDGKLVEIYSPWFEEYDRVRFNRNFAPENWNYKEDGTPDVVFMKRKDLDETPSTLNYIRKKAADTIEKGGPMIDWATRKLADEGGYLYVEFPATGRVPVETVIPVSEVGAAYIAHGDTAGYKAWKKNLKADYSDKHIKLITKQAEKTFDSFAKMAEDAVVGKLQKHTDGLYVKGKSGAYWYNETFNEVERIFGTEDAKIMSGFLAATSVNTAVEENAKAAMKAFRAYKKGMAEGGLPQAQFRVDQAFPRVRAYEKKFITVNKKQVPNPKYKGPNTPMFTEAGTPKYNKNIHNVHVLKATTGELVGSPRGSGRKIHNFHKALLGDENAVVVDRWMLRAYGLPSKSSKLAPTTLEYDMIERLVKEGAERTGSTPREYQASLWLAQKIVDGDTRFAGEYEVILKNELKLNPDLRQELGIVTRKGMIGNNRGWTRFAVTNSMARFFAGAMAGGTVGDTWEERIRNGAIVGFGALPLSPALGKALIRKVSTSRETVDAVTRAVGRNVDEAGAGVTSQLDHAAPDVVGKPRPTLSEATNDSWEALQAETAAYGGKVEEARRGTIPREESMAEGARKLEAGEIPEEVRPGTAMAAEDIAGVSLRQEQLATEVQDLARMAVATGDPEAMDAALMGMVRLMEADPARLGVEAEAGRALGIIQETPELEHVRQIVAQIKESESMTPERLVQVIAAMGSVEDVVKMAKLTPWQKGQDVFIEYWMNGILSGPQTHMANFMGNLTASLITIPERAMAARLPGKSGQVVKGEAMAMIYGLFGSISEALAVAGQSFRKGEPLSGVTKFGGETRRFSKNINAANLGVDGSLGKAVDFMGTVINLPTRAIMTADEFFKVVNYRMQLRADAFRQATLNNITDPMAKAEFIENLVANPTPKMRNEARQFAAVNTFQNDMNKIGSALSQLSAAHPMIKLIMPFVRTPSNIAKWTIHHTPGLAHMSEAYRTAMKKGGAEADLAQAKMAMGGLITMFMVGLAATDQITGSRPKNSALAAQLHDAGWQEHSIKLGDAYVGFDRLDPLGMQMGMVADFVHYMGGGMGAEGIDPIELDKMATALMMSFADNVTSKTWMQGVSRVMQAIQDPERHGLNIGRNFIKSLVPYSGAVGQLERAMHPEQSEISKDVRGLFDTALSTLPFYSQELPVRRYPTSGEPMTVKGGADMPMMWRFISPVKVTFEKKDELSKAEMFLGERGLSVGFFPDKYQGLPLQPEEKDWLHAYAGQRMGQLLPATVNNPMFKGMADIDPDLAQNKLRQLKRDLWDADDMRLEFMETFPEYTESLEELKALELETAQEAQKDLEGMRGDLMGGGQADIMNLLGGGQ